MMKRREEDLALISHIPPLPSQDFLKDKLTSESKHMHMYTKFREEFTEARSMEVRVE